MDAFSNNRILFIFRSLLKFSSHSSYQCSNFSFSVIFFKIFFVVINYFFFTLCRILFLAYGNNKIIYNLIRFIGFLFINLCVRLLEFPSSITFSFEIKLFSLYDLIYIHCCYFFFFGILEILFFYMYFFECKLL